MSEVVMCKAIKSNGEPCQTPHGYSGDLCGIHQSQARRYADRLELIQLRREIVQLREEIRRLKAPSLVEFGMGRE